MLEVLRTHPQPLRFQSDQKRVVKLLNESLLLWNNAIFKDRCPHRGAKLSQGRVTSTSLECPYHGWQFDPSGRCTRVPQMESNRSIPSACNATTLPCTLHDGIAWRGTKAGMNPLVTNEPTWFQNDRCLVADYALEVPYSYLVQIENLLDPAHIHFVHDGYQGSRDRASPIKATLIANNEHEISASFTHTDDRVNVPDIVIRFLIPSVVDVSILDASGNTVRKNIIYVSPRDDASCNVMFRDVLMKDYMIPSSMPVLLKSHVEFLTDMLPVDSYQSVAKSIVKDIMEQDVSILVGQHDNDPMLYPYVMPTESDLLIRLFRAWYQRMKKCDPL